MISSDHILIGDATLLRLAQEVAVSCSAGNAICHRDNADYRIISDNGYYILQINLCNDEEDNWETILISNYSFI